MTTNRARRVISLTAVLALCAVLGACGNGADEASSGPKSFSTPEAATTALVAALQADDDAALLAIFGKDAGPLISPPEKGAESFRRGVVALAAQRKLGTEEIDDKTLVVLIGEEEWPLPAPLIKGKEGWAFDASLAENEILNRRIGHNELTALALLGAYLEAQWEYGLEDRDGDEVLEYAQKIRSSPGKHDGLYWEAQGGADPSPFGPLLAAADGSGSTKPSEPFMGYYFRVLTAQGAAAPSGAMSFVKDGNMTEGCALVAWPARHGDSGIMTYMISHQGKTYERDLGAETSKVAAAMSAFDPGEGWTLLE